MLVAGKPLSKEARRVRRPGGTGVSPATIPDTIHPRPTLSLVGVSAMHSDRFRFKFDSLARGLTAVRSRRAAVSLAAAAMLGGSAPAIVAAKKCGFCQKHKRGRCKRNANKNGVLCAGDRVCQNGRCLPFDLTCPATANSCTTLTRCGPASDNYDCECYVRIGGGSACSTTISCTNVACTSDLDCPPGRVCIGSCADCASGTACAEPCRPNT